MTTLGILIELLSTGPRAFEDLLVERYIERAAIRLARAMDQHAWDVWRAILLPNAAADFGAGQLKG